MKQIILTNIIILILNSFCFAQIDLFKIVENGDIKELKAVLKLGVNPDTLTIYNQTTPLFESVIKENYNAVKLLLKYSANPNILYKREYYIYDFAKSKKIKRLLKKHDAVSGEEFLKLVWKSEYKKIELMVEKGLDVTYRNYDFSIYEDALAISVEIGDTNMVKFLFENKKKNRYFECANYNPFEIAINNSDTSILNLLHVYFYDYYFFSIQNFDNFISNFDNNYKIKTLKNLPASFTSQETGINLLKSAIKLNNQAIVDLFLAEKSVNNPLKNISDLEFNKDTSKLYQYYDSICTNKFIEFSDIPFVFSVLGKFAGELDKNIILAHGKYDILIDENSEKFIQMFPDYNDKFYLFEVNKQNSILKDKYFCSLSNYCNFSNDKLLQFNDFRIKIIDTLNTDTISLFCGKTYGNVDILLLKNQFKLDLACSDTAVKIKSFKIQINNDSIQINTNAIFSNEIRKLLKEVKINDSLKFTEIQLVNSENVNYCTNNIKLRVDSIECLSLTCLPNFNGLRNCKLNENIFNQKMQISNNYSNLKIKSFELMVYWGDGFAPDYEKSNGDLFSNEQLLQIGKYFNGGNSNIYFRNIIAETKSGDEIFLRDFVLYPE